MEILNKFNINGLTYNLGYHLSNDKIYPCIEIYKDENLLSSCVWNNNGLFYLCAKDLVCNSYGYVNTINEMFNWLIKYNSIPNEIKIKFENIFNTYKKNDFNVI